MPIGTTFHSVDYKMTVAMDIIRLMAQMAFTKLGKKFVITLFGEKLLEAAQNSED